jgi:uncharacterized membrane protein YphA (DoxX/SURF4 family)
MFSFQQQLRREGTPVFFRVKPRDLPGRIAAGGYILHSGLEKWHADEARAKGVHKAASGAYPFLERIPPERFIKLLAAGEIAVGSALLAPFVPSALAGAALTGFSGSLLTMYLRTPAMHKPGSVWPTPAGMGVSKDVWMLGIGLGLVAGAVGDDTD